MNTNKMSPEETLLEAALEAGIDLEQVLRGLARRRARGVPPSGLAYCGGCRRYQLTAAFEERKTCDECRSRTREAKRVARAGVT